MSRISTGLSGGLLALSCLMLACCSSQPTPTTTTTTTTTTLAPRSAVYRFGTVAVAAAFPGSPAMGSNPATLTALLPPHSSVIAWSVGDVGALLVHSYELVLARFPPGSTAGRIDAFLTSYGGRPNTRRYGRPALRKLSTIPLSSGTRYSGITAFSVGRVLVMAVAYDDVQAAVASWLDSVRLVTP